MPGVTSLSEDKLLKRSRYGMIRKDGIANIKKFKRMLRTRLRSLRSQTQARIPLYLQLTSIKSIRASTSNSDTFIRNNKLSLNNLPVEVLIRIFALLVEPVDALQVWRNCPDKSQLSWDANYNDMYAYTMNQISEAERSRKVLRLTCKMWNTIVLESVVEWNIDIGRTMTFIPHKFAKYPFGLQRLAITNSKDIQIRSSDISKWLQGNLSNLESFTVQGCRNFNGAGLMNLPYSLRELRIIDCPKISSRKLVQALQHLSNINYLAIDFSLLFSDGSLSKSIQSFLPRLKTIQLIIDSSSLSNTNLTRDSLPNHISELIFTQNHPRHRHYVLDSQEFLHKDAEYELWDKSLLLNNSDIYPFNLHQLDVSKCTLPYGVFALPRVLTHLSVGYPSLPVDWMHAKLPSTLEYLKILGYVYHVQYEEKDDDSYVAYGNKWIQMLPDNAPQLKTLILRIYTSISTDLYQTIGERYASSLQYFDLCILKPRYGSQAWMVEDNDEVAGRIKMLMSLKSLQEFRMHSLISDGELESMPESLRRLKMYKDFKNDVSEKALEMLIAKGVSIDEVDELFGCAEAGSICCCENVMTRTI